MVEAKPEDQIADLKVATIVEQHESYARKAIESYDLILP